MRRRHAHRSPEAERPNGTGWWGLLHRIGRLEWPILFAALFVTGAIWGFVELADEVVEGSTKAIDEMLLLALRDPQNPEEPLGPEWLEEMGRDFTALGGVGVLTLLTLTVSGYLLLQAKWRAALVILLSVGSGVLASTILKQGFDRVRPDLVPHGSIVYTASFPSGHSMMAAVTYLTLGALLARFRPRVRTKVYVLTMALLTTVLVGLSRVYLGVHWPTDVLAGWAAGALWATIWWLLTLMLQRRGHVEGEDERKQTEP